MYQDTSYGLIDLLPKVKVITPTPNALYYGDNLQVLRDYIPDESVGLAAPRARSSQGRQEALDV